MAQEWFYTNDGKSKVGPISAAELQACAKAGQLLPTAMVWKQGMTEWTAASAIKGLFANYEYTPKPRFAPAPSQEAQATVIIVGRLSLGLAVVLSLLAAVFALLRIGGEALGPIVAGLAVLLGLVAVGIGLSARTSRPFMGSAATAVFVGVAALLFSIGSSMAARTLKDASAVEDERRKSETARREAKGYKDQAEAKLEAALAEPKKLLKSVEKQKTELTAAKARIEADKVALEVRRKELAEQRTEVRKEREEVQRKKASLDKRESDLNEKDNNLRMEMKKPAALAKLAAEDRKKAEAAEGRSNELLAVAEKKKRAAERIEQEAKDHYKKVLEEYNKLKRLLKAKVAEDRKNAINTIGRIGPLPTWARAAKFDLRDVDRDLCEIVVNDTKLRDDALDALRRVEPELCRLTTTLLFPPVGSIDVPQYVTEIQKLSDYGREGLPLIQAHFNMFVKSFNKLNLDEAWEIFLADVEVLATVGKKAGAEEGLQILVDAPKSRFAANIRGKINQKNFPVPYTQLFQRLRGVVGDHVLDVSLARPQARKAENKKVIEYFSELLKSKSRYPDVEQEECKKNRLLGCKALGSFGVDAVSAVAELRKLQNYDSFDEVRKAAGDAMKKIEGKAK